MTSTKFSISQASRITGKSRTTLRSYIKQGKLSCVEGRSGERLLDASELARVFGDELDLDQAAPAGNRSANDQTGRVDKPGQSVQTELKLVRDQLEREISERNRERERLEHQLDELHSVLKRAQEGHANAMLLLENRAASAGDWQQPLKTLEAQLKKQQKEHLELRESARRKIGQLRKELEQERSKGFFARLLGQVGVGSPDTALAAHSKSSGQHK